MNVRKPARAFLLAAVIGAVAMGACSLNPQPIPPGEQSVAGDAGGSDFGGGNGGASDASATPSDGGVTGTPPEGGDAGEDAATDGGDLDASDADTDAHDE